MTKRIDDFKCLLFSTKDGSDACDAINKLANLAEKADEHARKVLALYVANGPIAHIREYACARLAESLSEPHAEFAALFLKGLADPKLRYWSILGYVNSAGKHAYKELVRIAENRRVGLTERAHAVKCLARFSKQRFDR